MKLYLYLAVMLILASSVYAGTWCYQENANVSSDCGLATGAYAVGTNPWRNVSYLYDGDWNTFGSTQTGDAYLYVNYTKPLAAANTSLWQIKTGAGTLNITINVTACWTNFTDKLVLRIDSRPNNPYTHILCYVNSTATETLYSSSNAASKYIYEEAMWWYLEYTNITVDLYDEQTGLWLNKSWYVEVWGDTFSANYSSTIGTVSLSNSTPAEAYNYRYSLENYATRNYYHLQTPHNTLTKLYTLNSSDSLLTLYTITDQAGTPLSGYTLAAYRKMMPSNAWEIVEMSVSDINGQGTLTLEPYNVNYMFYIYDASNNVVFSSSTPSVIPSNTIYFKVNTLSNSVQYYYNIMNVVTSLTWNNLTKNYTYTWTDPLQAVSIGWMEITKSNSLTTTTICNVTTSSYLGSVTCGIRAYENDTTSVFTIRGWVIANGTAYNTDTASYNNPSDLAKSVGLFGAFLALMIIGTMTMFGIWNPAAAIIFACVGLIMTKMFGLIPLGWTYVVGITALGLIAAYMVKT